MADWNQLLGDLEWCLKDPNRDGYGDINIGAAKKDAHKLDHGFHDCQSHSDKAKDNYDAHTPGQRIDAARHIRSKLGLG